MQEISTPSPSEPLLDVVAVSTARFIVAQGSSFGSIYVFDAATGTVLGSSFVKLFLGNRFARSASGGQVFFGTGISLFSVDTNTGAPKSVTEGNLGWIDVLDDPCAFAASAAPAVFVSPSGGSGTLTIPAPPGCNWSVDSSAVSGLTFNGSSSGSGPDTRTFSLAPASSPRIGSIYVGTVPVVIEATVPMMNVDFAQGQTVQQPFTVTGWAVDMNLATGDPASFLPQGIDGIQVWAYDRLGTPRFVGAAAYALSRPDVAAFLGSRYELSGFQITVANLPSGPYTLYFYAHSQRSKTYSSQMAVNVTVTAMAPTIVIDTPSSGATVGTPFSVGGWAVDPVGGNNGPNVDAIQIYAYPDGAAPIFLGSAKIGTARPDVGGLFGPNMVPSGYSLASARVAPGSYTLVVFAHSASRGVFTAQTERIVVAPSRPLMNVDTPARAPAGSTTPVTSSFVIAGWAIDQSSTAGSGIDAVQAWAYPVLGGAAVFVGTGKPVARSDVAGFAGKQFLVSGFEIQATIPSGTYDLAVFAHSTVAGTFNNVVVVRVVVP